MAFEAQFTYYTKTTWAQALELIDDSTGTALDAAEDAAFNLEVEDGCGRVMLTASTSDATIERPSANIIQWKFTPAQMASFYPGEPYRVGITAVDDGGTTQILVGTIDVIDGVVG